MVRKKSNYKKALVILGPTTTGKTEVAFELAQRLDGEVINGDKFYLFSDLKLSTGLSDSFYYNKIPHHLYQILKPAAESLSLVDYLLLVNPLIPKILARNRLPIIEGCSYGYTKALMDLNKLSKEPLYGPFVGLRFPRNYNVHTKIEKRIDQLFEEGLTSEVERALDKSYRYSYPMRKGVIILPVLELLEGKIDEKAAKDKIIVGMLEAMYSTLRKFLDVPNINWIEHSHENLENTISLIYKFIKRENKV